MSKYTTELRFICETEAGLSESVGYNGVAEVISKSRPKVFSFDYYINNDEIILRSSLLMNQNILNNVIVFRTFDDHRVAMALSGLSLVLGPVSVDHPEVVSKSYPTFWEEKSHIL